MYGRTELEFYVRFSVGIEKVEGEYTKIHKDHKTLKIEYLFM